MFSLSDSGEANQGAVLENWGCLQVGMPGMPDQGDQGGLLWGEWPFRVLQGQLPQGGADEGQAG